MCESRTVRCKLYGSPRPSSTRQNWRKSVSRVLCARPAACWSVSRARSNLRVREPLVVPPWAPQATGWPGNISYRRFQCFFRLGWKLSQASQFKVARQKCRLIDMDPDSRFMQDAQWLTVWYVAYVNSHNPSFQQQNKIWRTTTPVHLGRDCHPTHRAAAFTQTHGLSVFSYPVRLNKPGGPHLFRPTRSIYFI